LATLVIWSANDGRSLPVTCPDICIHKVGKRFGQWSITRYVCTCAIDIFGCWPFFINALICSGFLILQLVLRFPTGICSMFNLKILYVVITHFVHSSILQANGTKQFD
jgi:hypothetical protein